MDLIYYGNQRQLEYDFIVAAGADPKQIKMKFAGADKIEIDTVGDLLLHTSGEEVRMLASLDHPRTALRLRIGEPRVAASSGALTRFLFKD